jgi:hypothetical protein
MAKAAFFQSEHPVHIHQKLNVATNRSAVIRVRIAHHRESKPVTKQVLVAKRGVCLFFGRRFVEPHKAQTFCIISDRKQQQLFTKNKDGFKRYARCASWP